MDQAGILPGDYVILQKPNRVSLQPTPGDIVAVVFRDTEDRATLKRFLIGLNEVILRPESSNPRHTLRSLPLSQFTGDESTVEVVGIATAVLRPEDQKEREND
jgi:SOS-response transcriptional repressor LexA